MNHVNIKTVSPESLEIIKQRLFQEVQQQKDALHQVLRFYMFEYTVPLPIEGATKYMILHFDTLQVGETYSFNHTGYEMEAIPTTIKIIGKEGDTYTIEQTIHGKTTTLVIDIVKTELQRIIRHNGKEYHTLPQSGTGYRHILTQHADIVRYGNSDLEAGNITQNEKDAREIIHLFHDLPEIGHLELCNNETTKHKKQDSVRNEEFERGVNMIEHYGLPQQETDILTALYTMGENKEGIFKFYERFRRITDDNIDTFANREYMHNRKKLFGEMGSAFLPFLTRKFSLLSGVIVQPIELPSVQQKLRELADWIDFGLTYGEKHCLPAMHPQYQKEFSRNKKIRSEVKEYLKMKEAMK